MAVLAGILAGISLQAQQPGRSADLDTGAASFGGGSLSSPAAVGALSRPAPVAITPAALGGVEASGTHLWDTAILIPASKNLGLVMSQQTFTVELWNTYRRTQVDIPSIPFTGTGGAYLTGSIPASIGPLGSSIYTVTVPQRGSATISQTATFNLVRRLPSSPSWALGFPVSGLRVLLFPFEPDWTEPVIERLAYLTKIMPSRSGMEQRISLRTKPRREIAFSVFTEGEGQAQLLDSLLTDALPESWGVPWWMDQTPYVGTLAQGSTSIPINTENTRFAESEMVLLWDSPTSWEVQTVSSVSSSLITCSPLGKAWTNPLVVPLFTGRMDESQPVDWIYSKVSAAAIKFTVDA